MNNKLQPAIIGGVMLGLLSAIPFVNFLNLCCCGWAIIGGIVASYMYIKRSPVPATTGDGAILGAIAGAIGGVIYLIIGIPLSLLTGNVIVKMMTSIIANANPEQAEQIRQQMEAAQNQSLAEQLPGAIFGGIIGFVLLLIFATLGGLIAVPLLEKRKGGMNNPPPPPPSFTPHPGAPGYGR